ncbi:TPM domain-containing protein [Streptomyces sp. NBC_01716]|uniref:TPM domain-containing protein n=1 Tax=Streptomyces sp. NBC_01716 TaxID=2975917 RepID=UPI002E3174E3|nr:TPM domain-containing protein [Streptomyces sp. NBC_01716]
MLLTAGWLLIPAVSPDARAEDPVTLSRQGQITDKVGALDGRQGAVTASLDRLHRDARIHLFVVYVRDFSGRTGQRWAAATAGRNSLGRDDILLAVATHDRQYAYAAAAGSPLTEGRLAEVARTAVEPALRENDWAGAAIGAADGFRAVAAGAPIPTPAVSSGPVDPGGEAASNRSGSALVLPVVLVGGAAALAAYGFITRRNRASTRTTLHGGKETWGDAGPSPRTPLPELDRSAGQALVGTDDAVRTSEEELGFATVQFGEEKARPFQDAVTYAKGELASAFRLRSQLDDGSPADDAARRRMLDEIVARCTDANGRLDAESGDFDRLRARERDAPQALTTAEAGFRELSGRSVTAAATLTAMRERYAESASAPVGDAVEQADDRLVFTTANLDDARRSIEAGDNGAAAVYVRAAESAIGQAAILVEAVERRALELAEAAGKFPGSLTDLETDLADARGLLEGMEEGTPTADLEGRIARAEAVIADVRQEQAAGPRDPMDALRRTEEADAVLDEALVGAREGEAGRRTPALLDRASLGARSAVGAADGYISTHRGAVGGEARTRLAEAERRLDQAGTLTELGDAQGALAEAQHADALARQAQNLAEQDVRSFGNRSGPGGATGAGAGAGNGLGGAVLGGIILGGRSGGGGGDGDGGGDSGGRDAGPGSFGGAGTRGRMGGGGRF